MTTERKQMTGEEYLSRLREGALSENLDGAFSPFDASCLLKRGDFVQERSSERRDAQWAAYVDLIHRFYGTTLVTVSEDGTRTPWSPDRLGDGA